MITMNAEEEYNFLLRIKPKTAREALEKIEAANAFLNTRSKNKKDIFSLVAEFKQKKFGRSTPKEKESFTREFDTPLKYRMIAGKQASKDAMQSYLSNIAFNAKQVYSVL